MEVVALQPYNVELWVGGEGGVVKPNYAGLSTVCPLSKLNWKSATVNPTCPSASAYMQAAQNAQANGRQSNTSTSMSPSVLAVGCPWSYYDHQFHCLSRVKCLVFFSATWYHKHLNNSTIGHPGITMTIDLFMSPFLVWTLPQPWSTASHCWAVVEMNKCVFVPRHSVAVIYGPLLPSLDSELHFRSPPSKKTMDLTEGHRSLTFRGTRRVNWDLNLIGSTCLISLPGNFIIVNLCPHVGRTLY